mmetsp:Transcript_20960/g.66139  ORF Transcript_20960/g.66139 Transcript_20960/m.66139 type:complete len:219 (-) Transcript_20960:778-1434(-)
MARAAPQPWRAPVSRGSVEFGRVHGCHQFLWQWPRTSARVGGPGRDAPARPRARHPGLQSGNIGLHRGASLGLCVGSVVRYETAGPGAGRNYVQHHDECMCEGKTLGAGIVADGSDAAERPGAKCRHLQRRHQCVLLGRAMAACPPDFERHVAQQGHSKRRYVQRCSTRLRTRLVLGRCCHVAERGAADRPPARHGRIQLCHRFLRKWAVGVCQCIAG